MLIKNTNLNIHKFKKILLIFFIILFACHLLFRIYAYRGRYTTKFNSNYWKERYLKSQWVVPNSTNSIGDDGLYIYSSWELIKGADPTLINPETQYLSKYILGLTILLFKNENIFALIIGLSSLGVYYIFNYQIFKSKFWAFLPAMLFSFDPLFYTQLRAPFFDLTQLLFLLLVFIFIIKKKYFISSIMLGFFAASKLAFLAVLPVLAILIAITIHYKDKKEIYKYFLSLPISFFVFVLTYLRYFLIGHNFIDFIKVQKYILSFYKDGARSPFIGTIFPLILQGKWYTHFSTVQIVKEWSMLWPLSCIISVFSFFQRKNIQFPILLVISWSVIYGAFLAISPVFPRYLLLLLPFLYNLTVWVISKSIPLKLLSRQ